MKKLAESVEEWLLRRQWLVARRQRRVVGLSRGVAARAARRKSGTTIIVLPEQIVAERGQQRDQLLQVIHSILGALASNHSRRVKLDFSRVRRMYPGGMLMLLAYLELILESYPRRVRVACTPHSLPAQLLRHVGIADRLGLGADVSKPVHESVVGWRYLTGEVADGAPVTRLLEEYRAMTDVAIPPGLYEALTEALTNVRQHAYPVTAEIPETLRRWWLFAKYENPSPDRPGGLFIGVYDLGVGIQSTLRERLQPGEQLLDRAGAWLDWVGLDGSARLDRLLLDAAVERNRSRTGLAFRGNGLPEMRDFVLSTSSGRLSIVSGRAQYVCGAQLGQGAVVPSPSGFRGTLIVWSLPLQGKEAQA